MIIILDITGNEHEFEGSSIERVNENRRDTSLGSNTDDRRPSKRNNTSPSTSSSTSHSTTSTIENNASEGNQLDVTKISKKRSFRQIDGVPDKIFEPSKKVPEIEYKCKISWLDTLPNRKLVEQIDIDYELIFDRDLGSNKSPVKCIIKKKEDKRK